MTQQLSETYHLGDIDQIAFVVNNLDIALSTYTTLFGSFKSVLLPNIPVVYRDKETSIALKMAFGKNESLEIEIIEPVNKNGETGPFGEHLKTHGEGLHHVRFKVKNLQETLRLMEADGYKNIYGNLNSDRPWAYIEAPDKLGHTLIELIEGSSSSTT